MSYFRLTRSFVAIGVLMAVALVAVAPASVAGGPAKKKVLLIGIDGAGGRYVTEANTPHLDALAAAGTARYDFLNEGALTADPPSAFGSSGVNWSTILTGASAENHGVTDNSFAGSNFDQYPHFFQHIKQFDSQLYTASLSNWTPINTFITPDSFADLEVGYDSGTLATQDFQVKNDTVALLQGGNPDAIFLQFDQVDGAGHSFSWGSPQHIHSIEIVDSLIGEITTAIDARPGVVSGAEDWLILVTADHGAARGAFGHSATQGLENWEVPFIVSGPSVDSASQMQQGTLRDFAATALWHLGIDPFLAGLDGTVRGLTVEPPSGILGDLNGDGVFSGDGTGQAELDDVTTFLENWLVTGSGGIGDRYVRGDVNFDGVTDLGDWAILNNFNPAVGRAILSGLGQQVPEPATTATVVVGFFLLLISKRRHT